MTDSAKPSVSVVIPTHNRACLLVRALNALTGQSLSPEQFEVIVISDGSSDATEAVIERTRQVLPGLRLLTQKQRGPAAARNRGIAVARAPIIAFTDDDCIPSQDWLRNLIACFEEQPQAVGVEGRTISDDAAVTPLTHQVINTAGGRSRPTCNIAYRRRVLLDVGGFDEEFTFNGEDEDLALTVAKQGPIVFCADALVMHPPRRLTFYQHLQRMRRLELQAMLCQFQLAQKHGERFPRLRHDHGPWGSIFALIAKQGLDALWQHRAWLCRAPGIWLQAACLLGLRFFYRIGLIPIVCMKLRRLRSRASDIKILRLDTTLSFRRQSEL